LKVAKRGRLGQNPKVEPQWLNFGKHIVEGLVFGWRGLNRDEVKWV
jgi:hypothetical protein